MATYDVATNIGGGQAPNRSFYTTATTYEVELDFASAVTTAGTDLAASDVLEVMDIPANSVVLAAGFETITLPAEDTGTNLTALTLHLGVTGVDVDCFAASYNGLSAVGSYSQAPAAFQPVVIGGSNDTLDVTIATLTGNVEVGKIRVWAVVVDVDAKEAPGAAPRIDT